MNIKNFKKFAKKPCNFQSLAFSILFIGNQQSWSGIIIMSVTVATMLLSIGKLQNIIMNIR